MLQKLPDEMLQNQKLTTTKSIPANKKHFVIAELACLLLSRFVHFPMLFVFKFFRHYSVTNKLSNMKSIFLLES